MRLLTLLAVPALLTISGCSKFSEPDCSSTQAQDAVKDLVYKNAEARVRKLLGDLSRLDAFDHAKLMSALKKAEFALAEVRTTRKDPDSSRKFCAANLHISFPQDVLDTIRSARDEAGADSWDKVANRQGLDHDASGFSGNFEYSIQPTDDRSKLIAESSGAEAFLATLGDLFSSYLLSAEIHASKVVADQQAAADASATAAVEQANAQANVELVKADLDEAQAGNKLASQKISAVWRSIPQEDRVRLGPLQNAWNRKTDAQCTVQASGQTTDPQGIRAAKLRCETTLMEQRASELERYTSYNSSADSEF